MRIYSDIKSHETICERWGSSTKHPDSIHYYKDHVNSEIAERNEPWDIYAWLIETATDAYMPLHIPGYIRQINRIMKDYVNSIDKDETSWDFIEARF